MGSGLAFQQTHKWGQVSHFYKRSSFFNSCMGGACLVAAATRRFTGPEWTTASRFAIHKLPAAVRCLSRQATGAIRGILKALCDGSARRKLARKTGSPAICLVPKWHPSTPSQPASMPTCAFISSPVALPFPPTTSGSQLSSKNSIFLCSATRVW